MESLELAKKIAVLLDSKKADSIEVIGIGDLSIVADYFVICTGNSSTQVKALSDEVEFKLSELGIQPHHIEGFRGANWILMDYSSVVVHILNKESREFYKIERLWSDGKQIDLSDIIPKQ